MLVEHGEPIGLGPLAAALAKAQATFPAIERVREVRVKTKTGGEYTFRYAPLDTILSAVRVPLSANGLAIAQMLDGTDLVTILMHESGATLRASVPLPYNNGDTVQQLGSAITYLRRYALQAILGIASEEDDDGNAASGNTATARARRGTERRETAAGDGLIGVAEVGKPPADFELRQSPDGHVLMFRLVDGRKGMKVIVGPEIAEQIAEHRAAIEGQRITAWGSVSTETFRPKGATRDVEYQVLHLSRLSVGALTLPAASEAPRSEEPAEVAAEGTDSFSGAWGGPLDEPG